MKKANLLWRIYFWYLVLGGLVILGILVFNPQGFFTNNYFSNLYEIIFLLLGVGSIIAVRGFIYQKKYFSKELWVFIFSLLVIDLVGTFIYELNSIHVMELYILNMYIGMFLTTIPFYYALYQYAFKMNELWSTSND